MKIINNPADIGVIDAAQADYRPTSMRVQHALTVELERQQIAGVDIEKLTAAVVAALG